MLKMKLSRGTLWVNTEVITDDTYLHAFGSL